MSRHPQTFTFDDEPNQQLPENFSEMVLEAEMQLSVNPTLSILNQLLEFYSVTITQKGIEYYEGRNTIRFEGFKQRLQTLVIREDIIKLLQLSSGLDVPNTPIMVAPSPKNSRALFLQQSHDISLAGERNAQKIISSHTRDTQSVKRQASRNIMSQECDLEKRIQQRASNSINCSTLPSSPSSANNSFEITEKLSPEYEEFEELLITYEIEAEQVIEQLLYQKSQSMSNINAIYEAEIQSVQEQSSKEISDKVIHALLSKKEEDFLKCEKDFQAIKRLKLNELREKLRGNAYMVC